MARNQDQVNGVSKRHLPKRRNPEMAHPDYSELVNTRKLGQTTLSVAPGEVGANDATKPENLGYFDYAHLRAPLPEKLEGSEVHAHHPNANPPKAYFLMRRSSDGFVSATGMFKAAFPWAKVTEERSERDYLKSLPHTAHVEVAGNVWVSEHYAIELASEYGITPWILALLDEAPIAQAIDEPEKPITLPPKFKFTANDTPYLPPPNGAPQRASTPKSRGRPRAMSPVKNASPVKSTRKPRVSKKEKEADAANAREGSASLQASLDNAISATPAPSDSIDGDKVTVAVESNVERKGDTETTTTNVKIEMPSGSAELPLPESPEEMIEKAKQMVEEARKVDGESSSSSTKRKADELDEDTDDSTTQPSKKAKILEQELKTEKVRNRAMLGVAATLFLGSLIPYVLPA